MALLFSEKQENGLIGLWKITEEEDELLSLANLSSSDLQSFSNFKAAQRRKEWLATRILYNQLTGEPAVISYHPDGRPYLENSTINISISHTKGYAALLLHDHSIPGIDIELDSRSAEKVASRILSPEELESCIENEGYSNKKLLIHWCSKEVIFKIVPEHGVSYLKQIHISLNNPSGEIHAFSGTYYTESNHVPIDLFYKSFQELIVVWGWPSHSSKKKQTPFRKM